jgi:serine protease
MNRIFILIFVCLAATFATAQKTPVVPNQVLVQLSIEASPESVSQFIDQQLGNAAAFKHEKLLSKTMRIHLYAFDPAGVDIHTVLRHLNDCPKVLVAQYNHILQERLVPNDSFFGQQWHHVQSGDHDIDSDLAWDITTGGMTAYGDEIVVCVVEGGGAKWDQADIVDNHWVNTGEIANNGLDDDNNGYVDDYDGWNISDDNDNISAGSHGTQVSSMIGAKGNNDMGITGVNWDVKIMQVQMGGISENNVIEAYEYPLTMRKLYNQSNGTSGAFVVATNSSWGIDGGDPAEAPLWCAMYDSLGYYGVLSAGSTANNNVNVDVVGDLPTACPSDFMISVTASNNNDVRTFSGYGITTIDIAAPGEDVYLANNTSYSNTSGTSFAGPCVAGAVALLYSAPCNSLMELAYGAPNQAALDIKNYLMAGVDAVANLSDEVVSGGRLNVNNSLQLLLQNCSEGACVTPFNLSATQVSQSLDYQINWGTTASMLTFDIQYHEVGSDAFMIEENIGLPPYTLTGLNPCTAYEFQIIAHCDESSSTWTLPVTWTTDGCCEHPNEVVVSGITNANAIVTWNSVMAAMSYDVSVLENGISFQEFENLNENILTMGPLNPCANYQVIVSTNCGKIGPNEQSVSFNTIGCGSCQDLSYCEVFADAQYEFIANVTVDDYSNASGSDGGYVFVDGSSIALANETTYPITLTPGFANNQYPEYFKVWIDYNQNGSFEFSEVVFESDNASTSAVSGTFTVPAGLSPGVTRMRVGMSYIGSFGGGNIPVECDDSGFGEIEDYCVTLTGTNTVNDLAQNFILSLYPNPAGAFLYCIPAQPVGQTYRIIDAAGRVCMSGLVSSQVEIQQLAPGYYTFILKVNGEQLQQAFIKQ